MDIRVSGRGVWNFFDPNMPGWIGAVDRLKAETMLQSKPVGTYLLRNDVDFTNRAFRELEDSNHMPVNAFICTVKEPEEKISDILFLQTKKGWTTYEDNPDLSQNTYYPTLDQLIHSFRPRLREPLSV